MNGQRESVGFQRFLINRFVPFGEALPKFVDGYMSAYLDALAADHTGTPQAPALVNSHFHRYVASVSNRYDPHLSRGPFGYRLRVRDPELGAPTTPSRYSLIFYRMFDRSSAITKHLNETRERQNRKQVASNTKADVIYSPLYFARQILTAPDFVASEALVHAVLRAYIFEAALEFEDRWLSSSQRTLPRQSPSNAFLRVREMIRYDKVERTLDKIESFGRIRDNLPLKDGTDFIVSHLLASKGMLMMRFGGEDGLLSDSNDDRKPSITLETFLRSKTLVPEEGAYQFDKPKEVRKLPSAAQLINELDGLPLAVPGADRVFQGGLRFTTSAGLVGRLYGQAGVGKTSFALAMAAALAPLGTQTLYLSCEEQGDDLLQRIRTLVPGFLRRTQSWQDPSHWFRSQYVRGSATEKKAQIFAFLDQAIRQFGTTRPTTENSPPGLMPLLVVLDGVHEIFPRGGEAADGELRKLVERCQELGALVLAMSADNNRADLADFDYLVDLVATLEYAEPQGTMDPPSRVFRLKKTRRQLARTGAHVFELDCPEGGIRFRPQIDVYLDESHDRSWVSPNEHRVIDFLLKRDGFVPKPDGPEEDQPLVRISDLSQILVMGRGSSGKSLFGLRILGSTFLADEKLRALAGRRQDPGARQRRLELASGAAQPRPPSKQAAEYPWFEDVDPSSRRILVLSFLYQAPYYEELRKKQRNWTRDSLEPTPGLKLQLDVEHFAPGFLGPEELIGKVSNRIDAAILDGAPYHGVLIDGIHNVYLQFPVLEASEIVWPAVYELLRTRGLTVVTTHTHFDVSEYGSMMQDMQASRRRVAPLLHALVQSSDYVLKIHPIGSLKHDQSDFGSSTKQFYNLDNLNTSPPQNLSYRPPRPARYLIEVPGSLSETFIEPPIDWGWDRERGVAFQVHPLSGLVSSPPPREESGTFSPTRLKRARF